MKSLYPTFLFTMAVAAAPFGALSAEPEPDASKPDSEASVIAAQTPPVQARPAPIYRPSRVGTPARTVGGGSRGPGSGVPALYVLVPDHVAQTASAQPSLFWYIDKAPSGSMHFVFTLLDQDGLDPLVEAKLATPSGPGIQRIRLSDHAVELQPGVEYEWSVSLVLESGEPATDKVSIGFIDRVERSSELETRLSGRGDADAAYVFAESGLWYDALTSLGNALDAEPERADLGRAQAELLRQVGLKMVADGEVL